MNCKAKLFFNGRSQAVRLPVEFRFSGTEVYIRRNSNTGDVILSERPESWEDFFATPAAPEAADFLSDRSNEPPEERDVF